MSDAMVARRSEVRLAVAGEDIDIRSSLKSLSYTDNESGESDELTLTLEDVGGFWTVKWQGDSTSDEQQATGGTTYTVTAKIGLNIRSGPGTSFGKLGAYAFGARIMVFGISNGWATVHYGGKTAYVSAQYIQSTGEAVPGASGGASGDWQVGQTVTVSGRARYDSYGAKPGKTLTNHTGKITYLNIKNNAPYPIHVDHYGWFSVSEVVGVTTQTIGTQPAVAVDGFGKGLEITASIIRVNWQGDGKNDVIDCGVFSLDSMKVTGPPSQVTVRAVSLPFSGIRLTRKNRAWENIKLSGIANEIAKSHGLACTYQSAYDPLFERKEQSSRSDIAFLWSLCQDAALALKVTSKTLVLFDEALNERQEPFMVIDRTDPIWSKYDLQTGNGERYSACRVTHENAKTKALITAFFQAPGSDPGGPVLEIREKVTSQRQADDLARRSLRTKNKNETQVSFSFAGGPEWVAGRVVELKNWGAWDGRYVIRQVRTTKDKNGLKASVSFRKILEGY